MLIDTSAYILSLIRVFSGAALLLLALPLFMWRHYLRGKPYAYRFVFVLVTQNVFLINLVLLLGFFGICNRYTVLAGIAILYIIVTRQYARGRIVRLVRHWIREGKALSNGTRKFSAVKQSIRDSLAQKIHNVRYWPIWSYVVHNWAVIIALTIAVGYNIWFLTHNMLIYHSVQFSDIPVHQSWIYALSQGTLFVDGIYPFGMHCIVYLLHTLFFIDLREVLLYFGAFQTIMLLISIYLLARRVLRWKYSALIPVIAFSMLLNQGRYAGSLPQETGMFAVALGAYFLLGVFHTPLQKHVVKQDGRIKRFFRVNQYFNKRYLTNDALLFMLCVSLGIAYHFYTAIAMVMLVVAIMAVYFVRMLKKQYWAPIVLAGFLGVMIAVTPYAACLAKGIPFQESMAWALSVLNGEDWEGSEADYQTQLEDQLAEDGQQADQNADEITAQTAQTEPERSLREKLIYVYDSMRIFSNSTMYPDFFTDLLMATMGAGFVLGGIFVLFRKMRLIGLNYMSLSLYMVFMCIMGAAQMLGIPEVIAAARASTFAEPFIGIIYAIPFDFVFGIISLKLTRQAYSTLVAASLVLCGMGGYVIYENDMMHNFFDVNLAYYNEPTYLINKIRQEFPDDSYTIVATTDEYYTVLDYGFHENLSRFISMVEGNEPEYKIPTPYVFIFVEKKVLQDYYYGSVDVSEKYAQMDFVYFANSQDYYYQRAVLESKAYFWAKRFMQMYPNTCQVYFEDDIYIAYLVKQNPYYLYNFQVDYLDTEETT